MTQTLSAIMRANRLRIDPPLKPDFLLYLRKFARSRRLCWNEVYLIGKYAGKYSLDGSYGIEGEFFIPPVGADAPDHEGVLDYWSPPARQPTQDPALVPTDDGFYLEAADDVPEDAVVWLDYYIRTFLAPRGYVLNGRLDYGSFAVEVTNNQVVIV